MVKLITDRCYTLAVISRNASPRDYENASRGGGGAELRRHCGIGVPRQRLFVDRIFETRSSACITLTSDFAKSNTNMESLLSLSFDYLSSYDGVKIKKGLRQLEGLLAQICLSRSNPSAGDRRSSVIANGSSKQVTKELSSLKDDPAFREFFKLQEGFEWNGITIPEVTTGYPAKMNT